MSAKPAKKSRLGANPLDAMIPVQLAKGGGGDPPAKGSKAAPRREQPESVGEGSNKKPSTFHVDAGLLDEVRGAVVACAAPPLRLTLTDFVDRALRAELERLRKSQNGGKPFAPLGGVLRGGRRIGT